MMKLLLSDYQVFPRSTGGVPRPRYSERSAEVLIAAPVKERAGRPLEAASTVTVVIPAKDEEGSIGDIVDTVKSYAARSWSPTGTQDRTRAIAIEHRARVIQDRGRGNGESDELHGTFEQFIRYVGSQLITLAINYRWRVSFTDSQNRFRAIRRDVVSRLGLTSKVSAIEQEMLMKALKQGYRVSEVASHEYERRYGASKIVIWKHWFAFVWSFPRNLL